MKKTNKKGRGGGGQTPKPAAATNMDSDAENFSAMDDQQPEQRPTKGRILRDGRTLARVVANSADDLEAALEVINAGARIMHKAEGWNMKPEDYWQLQAFPSDPEDWEERMESLMASKVGDKDDLGSLMHSCTWIIDLLWKWLHEVATKAENPNHKRDAGRTLGRLYHQARQAGEEERLSNVNEEFRRGINPYPWGAKKPPNKELVNWVNRKMSWQYELWKEAVDVAYNFKRQKHFTKDKIDSNGVHHFNPLPMRNLREAWKSYFLQEREEGTTPSSSWDELLDELEGHPFCREALTLDQLTNFNTCWTLALYEVFKGEWNQDSGIKKVCRSFPKKFGDLKHLEGAGFHIAKDYFERFFLLHWSEEQRLQAMSEKSLQRDLKGFDSEDPLTRILLARDNPEKSSSG